MGVFILELFKEFNWFLFLFLIPFEVIGIEFLLGWFVMLTGPAWSLSWRFDRQGATKRWSGFGIGRSKTSELAAVTRLELHPPDPATSGSNSIRPLATSQPAGNYSLSFVAGENQELLSVDGLTEGEARWLADLLLREFPDWFAGRSRGDW